MEELLGNKCEGNKLGVRRKQQQAAATRAKSHTLLKAATSTLCTKSSNSMIFSVRSSTDTLASSTVHRMLSFMMPKARGLSLPERESQTG